MRDDQFERLYADHAQRLFAFLAYRTGDRALAEDLLADTFERALRGRRGFDRRKASEKTWLYAIALNGLRDHARRRAAEARALERTRAAVGILGPCRGTRQHRATRRAQPGARHPQRGGAGGDRAALRRRPDPARDRQAAARAPDDDRGTVGVWVMTRNGWTSCPR